MTANDFVISALRFLEGYRIGVPPDQYPIAIGPAPHYPPIGTNFTKLGDDFACAQQTQVKKSWVALLSHFRSFHPLRCDRL